MVEDLVKGRMLLHTSQVLVSSQHHLEVIVEEKCQPQKFLTTLITNQQYTTMSRKHFNPFVITNPHVDP